MTDGPTPSILIDRCPFTRFSVEPRAMPDLAGKGRSFWEFADVREYAEQLSAETGAAIVLLCPVPAADRGLS